MADVFSKKKRSEVMSRIRSKNTGLELKFLNLLSAELYGKGYRYRKHYRSATGVPDVAFVRQKVAVFLDSDFWHGRNYSTLRPKLKSAFWRNKIKRNIERDLEVTRKLRRDGWLVLRFWGTDLKKDPERAVRRVEDGLRGRDVAPFRVNGQAKDSKRRRVATVARRPLKKARRARR